MNSRKLLCLSVAAILVTGNIPPSLALAQNNEGNAVAAVQELSVNNLEEGFDSGEEIVPEEESAQEIEQEANLETYEDTQGELQASSSDYSFICSDDGNTVWISGYTGADTELKIPVQLDGKNVSGIADGAFQGRNEITKIELPDGVNYIGDRAFFNCSGLTDIKLPSDLTSLGESAFYGCGSLTEIELPSGLTSLGESVFWRCSGLTRVKLPSGLTSLGDRAFSDCSSLTDIELPSDLTSLGDWAFSSCKSLTGIKLPSGLKRIEDDAFQGCSGLTDIELPSGLASIGVSAFAFCSGLTRIKLPTTLWLIEESAFYGCSGLTEIELPSSLTVMGQQAFRDCSGLTRVKLPSGLTSLGAQMFYDCSSLTDIELPSGLMRLGNWAFYGCSSLTGIKLPSGLTDLGDGVFGHCSSLEEIEVDSANPNYQSIDGIVYNKEGTELVVCPGMRQELFMLPESVKCIKRTAFYGCSGLTGIKLPSGLTDIESSAFSGCSVLTNIELPSGLTSIGESAFSGCSGLVDIKLPSGLTDIGNSAFSGCSGLTEIRLPSGLMSLGNWAFSGCSSLASIDMPSELISIGYDAFINCSRLVMIVAPGSEAERYAKRRGISYEYKDIQEICTQDLSAITNVPQTADADFILPSYGKNGGVIAWTSGNKAVTIGKTTYAGVKAIVNRGETDVKVKLTATVTYGGVSASKVFQVTVKAAPQTNTAAKQAAKKALKATKITKSSITLYTGKTSHTATIKPVYPKNFTSKLKAADLKVKSVAYKSSQPKTVSVTRKGVATGLKAGSATVTMTITLSDGSKKSLQTKVTVKKPYLKVSGRQSVKKGKTLTLKVQKYGVKGTATWSVDKTKIAKIDAKTGKLTAKAAGTVKVTVKVGNLKNTYKVTVKK